VIIVIFFINFKEQIHTESTIFEPLMNLGKLSNNLDLNFMLEKLNELAHILNENNKSHVNEN
jgi:hypothetical protein